MYKVLLFLVFASLSVAMNKITFDCDCSLLEPLYKSFQCRSLCVRGKCVTKKDCSASPYILDYRQDKCYFQGKYYDVGQLLPQRYPDQSRLKMCSYVCRLSSLGPYFSPCYCVYEYSPFTNSCTFDTLFNPDYFNNWYATIYTPNTPPFLECPNTWAKPRPLNYTTVLCTKPQFCCRFGDTLIAKYDNFTLPGSNIVCTCMCPPLLQCLDFGNKYEW